MPPPAIASTPTHPSLAEPSTSTTPAPHHHALVHQVQHSLEHQHDWTSLHLHRSSPLPSRSSLPRPLISGLPPQRIYVHPDEQIELLKQGRDAPAEREWVLPTHVREKWTLRDLAGVFDAVGEVPSGGEGDGTGGKGRRGGKRVLLAVVGDDSTVVYYIVHEGIVKPRQN